MIKKALFWGLACLVSSGSFAADTFQVDLGKIQVFSSEIGSHPTFLTKVFNSKISAVDEQHPELAKALLEEVAAAGYQVATPPEKSQLYTIEEVYAGKPDSYTFPKESENTGLRFPLFHLLSNGLLCATLHVCNDPGIAANMVFDSLDSAQVEAIHHTVPKLSKGQNQATSMVISKLCTVLGRSCSLSVALAYDPVVSLDQLRLANAQEGFPRSMLLKK
ncbi:MULTISPECIES: hypothetical protein [Chromobacterium]|uniref:hypothetical protein n=1 Tax=Chromobacterium TaxID=535 RepID=UPI0018886300|nr:MULTISPECIES: hypothetical protein [Chromobacterium]QOZ83769.1 hypothetical protein DXT74_12280 [Chromobacterium sp. Rain0013]WON83903.1 hypothetical protein OK026_22825 [Chromobacterium haemolyticum]